MRRYHLSLEKVNSSALPEAPSERLWQWRPKRWKVFLIIMSIILVLGSAIIRFSAGDPQTWGNDKLNYHWIYNFNAIVLLLFAVWVAFSEREWPVWKRILWIIGLWFAQAFMQFIPFGIITFWLMGGAISNISIVTIILIFFTMRRSTFFVEPAPTDAKKSWLGSW